MVLGVSESAGGKGIHARITSPERWRKIGSYRKQNMVRTGMLAKIGKSLHLSQYTLRDSYLTPFSLLADRDPMEFARAFSLDADELNLLIHDKPRSQKVVKNLMDEERVKERERVKAGKVKGKKESEPSAIGGRSARPLPIPLNEPAPGQDTPGLPISPLTDSEPPGEVRKDGKNAPGDEKPEEKRTQKTLFDGF
ncbi:MAG: replication factor C large subunit [Euryarchaeota archaeon ADurb.BinA087]|nr:MAG: replication factor C large subunit [Euryarchaeota archaeon ADurb.BinA087]